MKVFNFVVSCIVLPFIAPAVADGTTCMNTNDKNCGFFAKSKGNDIYIYTSEQSNPIFTVPETESSVETISFLKKNNKYIIIKENNNSSKSKEILSFDGKLNNFEYLYLTSDIEFNQNNKYWHGIYCSSSNISFSESATSALEWGFEKLCKKHSESQNEHKYVGTDLFFSIDSIINGVIGKIKVIALNAKDNDNIDISYLGCLENCPSANEFTGKINNKYVIKMFLNINPEVIRGSYFYDKVKTHIPIKGIKDNKEIILNVEGQNGKVKEIFKGIINKSHIYGIWTNNENNTKYPFSLYQTLG